MLRELRRRSRRRPPASGFAASRVSAVNTLRQIPGVTEVKEDREAVELHAIEAEPVVRELLARDAQLSGLEVTSAGLEEAFLALTQRHSARTEIIRTDQTGNIQTAKEMQ